MQALLPVITTRRADRRDRGYLAWVAIAGEVAHLPLDSAPIDGSSHVLEIYVEGFDEPLVVLADPIGVPDDAGAFPLRLGPLDAAHAEALRRELFGFAVAPELAAKSPREGSRTLTLSGPTSRYSSVPPPLSLAHAESLTRTTGGGSPTSSRRAPGQLKGRALAAGRFVLESLLGGGASGEVYQAIHTVLRRRVAVKVLHPTLQQSLDYCARFYAEALAASQLDHRNVLRILDYGQEPDGILYIVMELVAGRNLQQILDQDGPLPLERLVNLVTQTCAGLSHAHDAGVVHRDIKPENVLVGTRMDDDGNLSELVKVCDFGIAHWVPDEQAGDIPDSTLVRLPDSRTVVGTPAYMAPEQIRNEPVDARTDVYTVGVLLYELSTGRLPFESPRPLEVLMLHVTERPALPSAIVRGDFDRELEAIVMKALEKDPAKRYQDMRSFRTALRELTDDDWATGSGQFRRVSLKGMPAVPDFSKNPAAALAQLKSANDKTQGIALQALSSALRVAVHECNVPLARDLLAWLEHRLVDPSLANDEREGIDRALRVVRDPAPIRVFASHLLLGKAERLEDLVPLLSIAGPVAARALLEARKSQTNSLEMRARFVSFVRATGPAALPVILGALEPLTGCESRLDEGLAEDLLRAAPDMRSDFGGELAMRFVRLDKPTLAVVALSAVVGFWGPRAHALILGVLDSTNDTVRLAAIDALAKMPVVDDAVLERLGRIVSNREKASVELRVAAARALALAPPPSRDRVVAFVRERLGPSATGVVGSLMTKAFGNKDDGRVLIALAASLALLDRPGATHVLERLGASRADIQIQIAELLRDSVP